MQGTRRTWLTQLLERRRPKITAVALANKNARIACSIECTAWVFASPSKSDGEAPPQQNYDRRAYRCTPEPIGKQQGIGDGACI
jgi:hypothetical protein